MVAKMMRWRPWPPLLPSTKFHVRLLVASLRGLPPLSPPLLVELCWKGPKLAWLRRSVKRNCTRVGEPSELGAVEWNEEFQNECALTAARDGGFLPWEISFAVVNALNDASKNKSSILGTASLNLADFVSESKEKEIDLSIPVSLANANNEPPLILHLTVNLLELSVTQSSSEISQRMVVPAPTSPNNETEISTDRNEVSSLMRKVKIFKEIVSTRKSKKTCQEDEGSEGRFSARSDDVEYMFDTDSIGDGLEAEDGKHNFSIRKSFSYDTLASANNVGGLYCSETRISHGFEDGVFYSHRRSDVGCSQMEVMSSITEQPALQALKRSILPWKKRKLSFRTPKIKGVPLLNKDYGEEGGDDIDFDRRQMSSSDESVGKGKGNRDSAAISSSISKFGDESFVVGSWETTEVVSRDGHMKICTEAFFASIDQRSERVAGESACTVLVAVIADWFQKNCGLMPNQSQFDGLIRDGSSDWRKLCENEIYRERFPDKHFDLETVIQAGIRPLSVAPSRSFIGFFHPEDAGNDNSIFSFLHGAMSFESIWDEIRRSASESTPDGYPDLYIVSWNDHLFALKVEPEAYYIIDTLGERLHEGCDRAYILKFDESTVIRRVPPRERTTEGESMESRDQQTQQSCEKIEDGNEEEDVVCKGKESCREYIKNFLAAIPVRELQADIRKGKTASTVIHQRLQVDFHYTQPLQQSS